MFSNQIERGVGGFWQGPFARMALGTSFLVAVASPIVSARTTPFALLIALLGLVVSCMLTRRSFRDSISSPTPLFLSISAFIFYAGLSAAWSQDPSLPLMKASLAGVFVCAADWCCRAIPKERRSNQLHLADGVWMGLLLGLVYLLIEILSDQAIKIWLFNAMSLSPADLRPARHFTWDDGLLVSIHELDLTRNTTPIALFFWPALMAARGSIVAPWNRVIAVAIVILSFAAVMLSLHESSKLALVLGAGVFLLARWSALWTKRLLVGLWVVCCLGVVPATLLAHKLDLHNAKWLQMSAQHRVIIWNHTAEQAMKAPIFGIGANMTYVMGPKLRDQFKNDATEREEVYRTLSRHAHNAFLQTWFELGLIGALLLATAGALMVRRIFEFDDAMRPYGFATFAACAAMVGVSYGMWQIWFMAVFALSAVMLAVGRAVFPANPDA